MDNSCPNGFGQEQQHGQFLKNPWSIRVMKSRLTRLVSCISVLVGIVQADKSNVVL